MENKNIEKKNIDNPYKILIYPFSNTSRQPTKKILIPELNTFNDTSDININLKESKNSQSTLKNIYSSIYSSSEEKIKNLIEENIQLKSQINNHLMQISILEQKLSEKSNFDSNILEKKIKKMEDELENKDIIISSLKKENKFLKKKLTIKEKIQFNCYKILNNNSLNNKNKNIRNYFLKKKPQKEEIKNENYNYLMNNNCISIIHEPKTISYQNYISNNNHDNNSNMISLSSLNDYISKNNSQKKNKKTISSYKEISSYVEKKMKHSGSCFHKKKHCRPNTFCNTARHNFKDDIKFTKNFYNYYLFGCKKTLSMKDLNNQRTIV